MLGIEPMPLLTINMHSVIDHCTITQSNLWYKNVFHVKKSVYDHIMGKSRNDTF